ncbi:60Kd inner membrane protein-domain-containing protein [Mycena epipterygia]|nr:60Kd inner membrane protein-domain-containing protein [Mycena epipterygia]
MALSLGVLRASSLRLSSRSPVFVLPIPHHRLLSTLNIHRYQRPQPVARWRSARWNSGAAASSASAPIIPTPPPPPTTTPPVDNFLLDIPNIENITDTIAAIPPLQHGDLHALGLCHWTPAGLVQYSFELVHVLTGLPWFHTFVVATIFWRLVIFPFAVIGQRNAARMRPVAKELQVHSEAAANARRNGDTVAMTRSSMAAAKVRKEAGVSMLGLAAPMIQLPISIGMFIGVKKMCELPVMQLTQSGFALIPDLTIPGPYLVLPTLVAISGNAMISLGARDMDPGRPELGHIMNGLRVLTVVAIFWMDHFPSGLMLSLLVTSATAVLQALIFRSPAFRRAVNIPQWTPPPPDAPKMPGMKDTALYVASSFGYNPGQKPQSNGAMPRLRPYTPPMASTTPAISMTPPPIPSPPPPPSGLDLIAQQAQANVSAKASSLYEAPAPPLPTPVSKTTKANVSAKSSSAPAPPSPTPASKTTKATKTAKAIKKPTKGKRT